MVPSVVDQVAMLWFAPSLPPVFVPAENDQTCRSDLQSDFLNQGQVFEMYAKQIYQSDLWGFLEVEEFIFGERTQVVSKIVFESALKVHKSFRSDYWKALMKSVCFMNLKKVFKGY